MPTPASVIASLMYHCESSINGWLGVSLFSFPTPLISEVRANIASKYVVDNDVDSVVREAVRITATYVLTHDQCYTAALVDRASEALIRLRPKSQS